MFYLLTTDSSDSPIIEPAAQQLNALQKWWSEIDWEVVVGIIIQRSLSILFITLLFFVLVLGLVACQAEDDTSMKNTGYLSMDITTNNSTATKAGINIIKYSDCMESQILMIKIQLNDNPLCLSQNEFVVITTPQNACLKTCTLVFRQAF